MPQTNLNKAKANAKKLGVTIEPSKVKNKKLDVFKDGKKIASIGDIRYTDFLQHGDKQKQENYLKRHAKTRAVKGSPSYYAAEILWR
jgi:hypothetical protein